MLEVTVSDETGWDFDTLRRTYANVGLDKSSETTLVAWKIVQPSPGSTALKPEETREEKMIFRVEPRDARQFTVRAVMRYFFTPPPPGGFGPESDAPEMAQATLTIPGAPGTTDSRSRLRGISPWPSPDSSPRSRAGPSVEQGVRPSRLLRRSSDG